MRLENRAKRFEFVADFDEEIPAWRVRVHDKVAGT